MVVVRERLTKVKAFPFRDACPSISDLSSNMVKIAPIWSNMDGYWFPKLSKKVKTIVFPEMIQNGLEMVPIASGVLGAGFYSIITSSYIIKRNLFFPLFITPVPLLNFLFPLWDTRPC